MTHQFHVRFNISDIVYKTCFAVRKLDFKLKLETEEMLGAGNWKDSKLIREGGRLE